MFPKKLPSRIKDNTKSLEIRSAEESTKMHVEFLFWPRAVPLPIREIVEFDISGMICSFTFETQSSVDANPLEAQLLIRLDMY